MFKTQQSRTKLGQYVGGLLLLEGFLTVIALITWGAKINPQKGTPKTTRPFISFWDWSFIIGNSIAAGIAIVVIVITLFGIWIRRAPGDGKQDLVDVITKHGEY